MVRAGPILIMGGEGQVARALSASAAFGGLPAIRVGRPVFDFERPETIELVVRECSPSILINAAAYTAVDAAESDEAAAYRANSEGPAQLAKLAAAHRFTLIHISTDYVFDGEKGEPYAETDATRPTGIYGASRLAGEQAILQSGADAIILRTSWVYAPQGRNFVLTMLNAAKRTNALRVVADQKGCPTAAGDLADAIVSIVTEVRTMGWRPDYAGVYHAAGSGWTTWHGFATAIFAAAARYGHPQPSVEAIVTADWPTPARRPLDSRLNCAKLADRFAIRLPDWTQTLSHVITDILS